MHYTAADHTFSVCAYKESPYLEECICSLLSQSVKTNIIIATSTPNEYIKALADKYNLPVFVNIGESGISGDWNFALSAAKTELITIAHQDDIYEPEYAEKLLKTVNRRKNIILYSCNYGELRNGVKINSNRLLNVKKILRIPMRLFPNRVFARRMSLAFGDSICCPSVTYVKSIISEHPFTKDYKADLDWQQWEKLSKLEGAFAYCNDYLMYHRIHEESETSHVIGETGRGREDYEMFLRFWPVPVAKLLAHRYADAEKSNDME